MARQHWLQRNQAVQVLNAYAEALSQGKSSQRGSAPRHDGPRSAANGTKVSGSALLGMMAQRTAKEQ